ncbi:hypothetical protein DVH24_042632 [Malus domestica]|uniref:Uncharacterized protein n=1 Tax=Malus domestica TaxID=3750 RepID=A0A498I1L3_MALDO|nr:hypothetical protein DVH24_042632 [Malus domestica]
MVVRVLVLIAKVLGAKELATQAPESASEAPIDHALILQFAQHRCLLEGLGWGLKAKGGSGGVEGVVDMGREKGWEVKKEELEKWVEGEGGRFSVYGYVWFWD